MIVDYLLICCDRYPFSESEEGEEISRGSVEDLFNLSVFTVLSEEDNSVSVEELAELSAVNFIEGHNNLISRP